MTIQWRTILKFGMANVNFIEEKKKKKNRLATNHHESINIHMLLYVEENDTLHWAPKIFLILWDPYIQTNKINN